MSTTTYQMPDNKGPIDGCEAKIHTNASYTNLNMNHLATEHKENKQNSSVGTSSGISSNSSSRSNTITSNPEFDCSGSDSYCGYTAQGSCESFSYHLQSTSIEIEKFRHILSNDSQPKNKHLQTSFEFDDNEDQVVDGNWPVEALSPIELLDQFYSFPRLFIKSELDEKNQLRPFVLQPSLFHRNYFPPTIYFNTKLTKDSKPPIGLPKHFNYLFKWKISNITPNSIRNCISFMEFEVIKPSNKMETKFVGSWYKHMLTTEFSQLEEWRKVNHYPGSFHLGRKDKLWYKLATANLKHGPENFGNFQPITFVLPKDYDALCDYWKESPSKLFIIKPPASARGNGIKVINDISQIPVAALQSNVAQNSDGVIGNSKKSTMIVQQYISNPCLLENGQKFDLRVYVLLTSVDPLRIYVYEEGLVRFATAKYTPQEDGIIDQYMHLTNYFINKNNREYQINNDCDSLNGCKWTLRTLWKYLKEHHAHVDKEHLWDRIVDIIIKTIICCEAPMTRLSRLNCKSDYTSYELFGFDIILDENFQPWILEVNITPSLKSESDLDTSVKYGVIKDMFNLVGYNLPPAQDHTFEELNNVVGYDLSFDPSILYSENLTKRDKVKHLRYNKMFRMEYSPTVNNDLDVEEDSVVCNQSNKNQSVNDQDSDSDDENDSPSKQTFSNDVNGAISKIINDLTQNDLRVLMLAEDELTRCGDFKRVFPSKTSSKYLKYFDKPRYYNYLLDAWEQKYNGNRLKGIKRLSKLATFMD